LKRILIFGNSGSAKTTLAQRLCKQYQLAHLDLDTIAWQAAVSANKPPQRNALSKSKILIDSFCDTHPQSNMSDIVGQLDANDPLLALGRVLDWQP